MSFFLQGLSLGLAYVAPIGLQNLFVINSALNSNRGRALLTALIVICFDVALALACFFGVGALLQRYVNLRLALLGVGGLLVTGIGVGLLFAKVAPAEDYRPAASLRQTVVSACVVTWLNPQALIDSTMLLGSFHTTLPAAGQLPFISGVAAASCLWFSALALTISLVRRRFAPKILRRINIVCGVIIIFYGLQLLRHFLALI